jgi:NADH-quinone oxidoreductase subunit G
MCDEGRLGYHYINSPDRLRAPLVRRDGTTSSPPWPEVIVTLRKDLMAQATRNPSGMAGVLSPFMTCEEAFLFAKLLKGSSGQIRLAMGPVPVIGEDDTYPKDSRGRPVQPVKFTIHAEKCPNRKGVEAVLQHFQGEVIPFDQVVSAADKGALEAVYIVGGYRPRDGDWIDERAASALVKARLLIVQDLWPTVLSTAPTTRYVLPSVSFAEKEGTFVNHAGLAQAIHWANAPPGEARPDGQIFMDLMERHGLVNAAIIRKEMAAEVAYFAPLLQQEPGEQGVMLG